MLGLSRLSALPFKWLLKDRPLVKRRRQAGRAISADENKRQAPALYGLRNRHDAIACDVYVEQRKIERRNLRQRVALIDEITTPRRSRQSRFSPPRLRFSLSSISRFANAGISLTRSPRACAMRSAPYFGRWSRGCYRREVGLFVEPPVGFCGRLQLMGLIFSAPTPACGHHVIRRWLNGAAQMLILLTPSQS
jgi:hypothetical protein